MKSTLSLIAVAAILISSAFAEDVKTKFTAAGEQIGTTATQKIAFHGATPVVLRSSSAQTALTDNTGGSTSDATLATVTAPSALTDNTGGSASTTLAAISDTATKNAVASLAAQQAADLAAIVALTNAVAKEAKLINELRAALVEKGLIKGQ